MPLSAWRKWWRRSSPRSKKLSKKPNFRKCFLEILEDRTLLSNIYTVNLTSDNVVNTGQQTGQFSGDLRWCIEQADLNPGSTIQFDNTVFPVSTSTTIRLSQGELQVAASMNIQGPGASVVTVSGNDFKGGRSRVFDITSSNAVVTIAGLTIADGNAAPNYTPVSGNQGGDIFNGGTLTLQNDIVTNGFSVGNVGGPNGRGGAIYNAEGQGNTKLILDNTIVEASTAKGLSFTGLKALDGWPRAQSGANAGPGQGGGIFNDATAQLILENGTQIINNNALGGDGEDGGNGLTITATGAPGGNGGNGGNAGFAEGGGIYNAGSVQLNGTNATSVVLADNIAQGGKGGLGGSGGTGQNGARGGNGGNSGSGGSGGFADGGGVYNTGSVSFPSSISLQYVNFLGNQAIGGAGNNSNVAGNAGNGSKVQGGTGGQGGRGGDGGNAQGGAIYTAWGTLTVPNVLFGLDANGVSDQALGGGTGNGGTAGNGGNSSGGVAFGRGTQGAPSGKGGDGGNGGFAKGGAVANVAPNGGNVFFTSTTFDSTVAKGGNGSNGGDSGMGGQGAAANEGSTKTPYSAGLGGVGEPGGNGGVGGAAVGGGIFNAIGSLSITTSTFLSDQAIAGSGGTGGTGGTGGNGGNKTSKSIHGVTFQNGGSGGVGGTGGVGGNAQGGGFYNLVGAVTVLNSTFKAKTAGGIGNEVIGGSGGGSGAGGTGGQGGDNGSSMGNVTGGAGGPAGTGGIASNGGFAEGGAGGNQGGDTNLTGDIFTSSLVQMGIGGKGGAGGRGGDGGDSTSAGHGADGVGGNGGDGAGGAGFNVYGNGFNGSGFGGAFADTAGNLTVTNTTFGGNSAALGNQVVGGAGGVGGVGGGWGHWGHRGGGSYAWRTGFFPFAGNGGHGGLGAWVYGGALSVSAAAQTVQITNTTFTNSSITSGNGGNGGQAGLYSFEGSNRGINGIGGDGGLAQGGAVSISAPASSAQSATLNIVTISSSRATGGTGGTGAVNFLGSVNAGLFANSNGDGSAGGNGGSVQGVGLAVVNYNLNSTNSGVVQSINSFAGLDYISSNNNAPPDPQVAAGPNSYVETVSQTIALYNKSTGASLSLPDSLADFWTNQGKLARADAGSTFANPTVLWDEQIQRFIVAEQDVDLSTHVSTFNIAVSKSASPATLTGADWNFFQVNTTENTSNGFSANYDAKNPGSLGWNHDALVFTLNMVNQSGSIDHVQVNSVSIGALQNNTALSKGVNAFQIDIAGANLRPTIMHDSRAGDPMWFVEEGGNNQSLKVVEMTNPLSATPTFTTSSLAVNPYTQAVPPKQPSGVITTKIDSSIQKVAEQNGLLVAAHTVSDIAGDEDNVQWYIIDVSSGTPKLQQQGDVSGGSGVYDAFPSIDINPQGSIGMTYIQSGTGAGQYMSMYVTGRVPTDLAGMMAAPIRVQAGQANYSDFTGGSEGSLSGISVDSDGSFWAANEFANTEAKANWGTQVSHFNLISGPSSFTGGVGKAGQGGAGGTISNTEPFTFKGGAGGNGGAVLGGGIFFSNNGSGTLNFKFTNGFASNNVLNGGVGGNGGHAGGSGNRNIAGGDGGNGARAQGGGIYILAGSSSVNNTSLGKLLLDGNVLVGGKGGVGGAGAFFNNDGSKGGAGGDADGGGLYNSSSNATTSSSLSINASTLASNQVTSGIGGDAGSGTTPNGGAGAPGGNAGNADGAGLFNGNQTSLIVVNTTFGGGSTNPTAPNANANILIGGRGGRGGDAGTPTGVLRNNGGAGGSGGTIEGANVYNSSNTTNYFINDTLVDGQATSPGLGGAGGSGAGQGGTNGPAGANGVGLAGGFFAAAGTNEVGNSILDLNNALSGLVRSINNFAGLDYNSSNNNAPPDPQIAAGPSSYIETVSQTIALYGKNTGTQLAFDSLLDFWTNQGKLARADAGSIFANPTVLWDEQIQSFIIAEQDIDLSTHVSAFNIAVSKSANPATLTSADWNFFQVNTTENTSNGFPVNYDAKNPGSLGWNHDALVFTLNMVDQSGSIDHVQVNSVSISALQNNTALSKGVNAFQIDIAGANLRPTVMHDAKAGDPMWLVQEGGNNQSIKVVEMTNVLSVSPSFSSSTLAVNPYTQAVAPKQSGGSTITTNIDSSIQKVAEQNGLLVAAHTVSDNAGDEDNIQWYILDVSSGTPKLQQQGDVSGGPGIYDAFPSIDINAQGTVGLTYLQSGTSQLLSMYVTGRLAQDLPGTMATPVLVRPGLTLTSNEGSISGISVDSDGSFWAANEYARNEPTGNWGTEISHFNLAPTPNVSGNFTSLGNNILGSTFNSTGFSAANNDQIDVTAAQLNLGPLLNNGGTTLTDALLNNSNGKGKSVAIDAGGNTLVTNSANPWFNLFGPTPTDQRGTGFPRLNNNTVDVGAFEFNPPVISSLNPPSAVEQGPAFVLTITGTGFATGATVSFGGTTLFPTNISLTQIQVTVPTQLLPNETPLNQPVNVTVSVPDGSGVNGETLTSNTMPFTITEGTSVTLSNPGNQNNSEGDQVSLDPITSSDPDTTFNDIVNGQHTLPTGLSINLNTGVISGTIDRRGAGAYNVTINGIDDGTVQGSVQFTWNVVDSTPPDLTAPPTQNNNEGDVLSAANNNTVTVSAVDADPGTFTDVVSGKHTLPKGLSIDANGVISGTIDPRAAGTYTVTITASDNGNASSVGFQWIVADTTPPVVTAPSNQVNNEGDTIKPLTISAVDADSFTITGLPGGLTYNSTTGVISGTINNYADGIYTVTITASDNGYQSTPVAFTWTVNDTTPPSFTNPGPQTNNEGDTNVSVATKPVDADPGSITATGLPKGLTIDSTTGVISGTIDPRAAGTYTVKVSATDGASNIGNTTFTWTVNDTTPPVVTQPSNQNSNEGQTITPLTINAVDADSFTITGLPGGLTYNSKTGVISGTINNYADGNYTVTVTATDNGYQSTPVAFTWTVNDTTPPALTTPSNQINNEGDTIKPLTIQATDAESFNITGLPTGLSFNANTGVISGTIDSRGAGTYTVNVTAFDGALSSPTSFTWTVNDTTPPTVNNPGTRNNNEGDNVNLQIGSTDADPGSFSATGLPLGLSINPNTGLISGTIDARAAGSYTVTVSATDGPTNIGSTTFTWNVADTTAPALTNPNAQSNNEGDKVTLPIKAVDADSFSATGLPTGLSIDSTTGIISGTIDAHAADNSPYTVTVFAFDNGNQSSVTFTWTVADTTPPSFTNPGDQINNEGDTVNLATNPVGADPGTITATGLPPGLSINANTGVISGTINVHGAGAYNVVISASDNGNSSSISLVWRVNDTTPPVLFNPGTQNTNNGTAVGVAIPAIDADPGTFTASGLPAGLSINANTGVISGTVLAQAGTYHVTVTASDGGVASSVSFAWVVNPSPISVVITNIHNIYVGVFQVETVTAQVTNPGGFTINSGSVTFHVNGETLAAPVINGFATVTFVTPMVSLDPAIFMNDFVTHSLDAVYSDPSGIFGTGGASVSEPPMLLDFLLFLQASQFGALAQQLAQLQQNQ